MKEIKSIIYRYLTDADFFNMYKPRRTEAGGGGQLYIDFLTSTIPVNKWRQFFSGVNNLEQGQVRNGPIWEFTIYSMGTQSSQRLRVYQRRTASICIPNQNINTRSANRVYAWRTSQGFPEPQDPTNRRCLPHGLVVYLVRTHGKEIWAGWFRNDTASPSPCQNDAAVHILNEMVETDRNTGEVGYIRLKREYLFMDESNSTAPFFSTINQRRVKKKAVKKIRPTLQTDDIIATRIRQRRQRTEDEIIDSLFGEDEEYAANVETAAKRKIILRIRQRNTSAIRDLKELYEHQCQITGNIYTFLKRNGVPYTEVHHLVPLANGGADNPLNMIIVSPLVHRMLHYAEVEGIDFAKIQEESDGSASLSIKINNENHTITWKSQHAERILAQMDSDSG